MIPILGRFSRARAPEPVVQVIGWLEAAGLNKATAVITSLELIDDEDRDGMMATLRDGGLVVVGKNDEFSIVINIASSSQPVVLKCRFDAIGLVVFDAAFADGAAVRQTDLLPPQQRRNRWVM
jgi:hypothetical protein